MDFPGRKCRSAKPTFRTIHHRAFHAGAVLGIVNASPLRFDPVTSGPSGIDDASARHGSGSCAMVATLSMRE
jgi:hypothetical protein